MRPILIHPALGIGWGFARLTCAVSLLVAAGCRSPEVAHPGHVFAIEAQGEIRLLSGQTNTSRPLRSLRSVLPTDARQVRRIDQFRRQARDEVNFIFSRNEELDRHTNILVFFQGGLNTIDTGIRRANALTREILTNSSAPAYPIFVAWNANLFSAWGEQYTTHRGHNAPKTAAALAPFTFAANVGRLFSRLPLSMYEQGYAGVRTMRAPAFGADTNAPDFLPRPERVNEQVRKLRMEGFDVKLSPSAGTSGLGPRGALMVAQAAPKILSEGILDAGGKVAWDYMLRRTQTMFTHANTFEPGAMEYFAEALAHYVQRRTNVHVTIVGHSMGAIVAGEFIRRHGDQLKLSNIVFMAAACGVGEFDRTIIPFLVRHRGVHFYNLSQHPANDSSELAYAWGEPLVPRGSLLDWIDAYYSSAETDYGWTLGKWENVILSSKYFLDDLVRSPAEKARLRGQLHFKCFGFGPEERFGPQHHGGFDRWRFWLPEFWQEEGSQPEWRHHLLD